MKKIKYIYLCVFLLITLSACSVFTTQQSEYDRNNSNIEEKILTNSNPINSNYISFTASEQISEKEIKSTVYCYDIEQDTIKKIFTFDFTTQHPLGVYDKKSNSVFYTKGIKCPDYIAREHINSTDNGDQLYKINLDTMEENQLTKDFFAINEIVPTKDFIYIVGRKYEGRVLVLQSINRNNGEIKIWNNDNDTNVVSINVDESNNNIFVVAYSKTEARSELEQDENGNIIRYFTTVYKTDLNLNTKEPLFSDRDKISMVLNKDENNIIALSSKTTFDDNDNMITTYSYLNYDLTNKSLEKSEREKVIVQYGVANYGINTNHIFGISLINDERGIVKFDLQNNNNTIIFEQGNKFINNMRVFK